MHAEMGPLCKYGTMLQHMRTSPTFRVSCVLLGKLLHQTALLMQQNKGAAKGSSPQRETSDNVRHARLGNVCRGVHIEASGIAL